MPVIGLSGPNAIGKTTAVRRWVTRYPLLLGALADNQREASGKDWDEVLSSRPNVRAWKGTIAEKEELVGSHRVSTRVTVIDSARTTALNFFLPAEPIIFVVCSWATMERNLRARCVASGKRFREDYWDRRKLEYEASRRYLNFVDGRRGNFRVFRVDDYERDWPAVDEYFGSLYRPLHNASIRREKYNAR